MDIMKAITAAMNIETIKADVNKTPEQKMTEINEQNAIVATCGVDKLAAMGNEIVNNRTETDGLLEAAGFNGRDIRRDDAIAGVTAQIAALTDQQADGDEQD